MKRFLLAAFTIILSVPLAAQTPTALWGKMAYALKRTDGSSIQMAADGNLYIMGGASTRTADDGVYFGSDKIAPGSVYYGTNTESSVKMMFLSKITTDGSPIWTVYSRDMDMTSNSSSMVSTSDGVIALVTLRHPDKAADHSPVIVDATGKETSLEWTLESSDASRYYILIVMKLSSDGALQWVRKMEADHTPRSSEQKVLEQGLFFSAIVQDAEGNLYIGGRQTTEISVPKSDGSTAKLAPHNVPATWDGKESVGDLIVIKLDKDGYYLQHMQTGGDAKYVNINSMEHAGGRIYVMGYIVPQAAATQISIGGQSVTLPNEFATPFLASLNTDLTAQWAQTYETKKKGFAMQSVGQCIDENNIWLVATSMMSLTTKSGKSLDTGDLTRAGSVLKFSKSNGDLLDGYLHATDQTGYFAAFQSTDGKLYAFCRQGNSSENGYEGGAMWVDTFNPADLTAPVSTWDNMIGNAVNTQGIVYTSEGKLYTMTGSRAKQNSILGTALTVPQDKNYYCNVCAFQLPVTPVTAIRTIEQVSKTTDGPYYTLSGQRIDAPTKGIYIHNGKKVVIQ